MCMVLHVCVLCRIVPQQFLTKWTIFVKFGMNVMSLENAAPV
jgi:hypothetical protein